MADEKLCPGDKIGPYVISSFVAEGGMADIYRAQKDACSIVLKVCPVSGKHVQNLNWEAEIASIVCPHPNIVNVYGLEQIDNLAVLSMESLDGSVDDLVQKAHKFSIRDVLLIARDTASALSHMHGKKIMHNDIKPANILLNGKNLKLCDFGISYDMNRHLPKYPPFDFPGTRGFTSPEYWMYGPSPLADIYSLGITVFKIIHGKGSMSREEINTDIFNSVPFFIKCELLKSIEDREKNRFQSANELLDSLEKILDKLDHWF